VPRDACISPPRCSREYHRGEKLVKTLSKNLQFRLRKSLERAVQDPFPSRCRRVQWRAHIFGNRIRDDKTRADAISRPAFTRKSVRTHLHNITHSRSRASRNFSHLFLLSSRGTTHQDPLRRGALQRGDASGRRWESVVRFGVSLDRDRPRRHFGVISREEDLAEAPGIMRLCGLIVLMFAANTVLARYHVSLHLARVVHLRAEQEKSLTYRSVFSFFFFFFFRARCIICHF